MNAALAQRQAGSLLDDEKTLRKLELNFRKNKEQDHTHAIDAAAAAFRFEECRDIYWNPENFSLLWGTPLWDQASPAQRLTLNHLYWVAYYAQIISAEIATILLNQTGAAGLNTMEDFRLVCDTLDLETAQERAHINAFKTVGEKVEESLFGRRVFTYPMRSLYEETMIFSRAGPAQRFWRSIQLRFYTQLSCGNAFIGCQYFAIRGLRTLNGKMIQQALAQPALRSEDAPIPSKISLYHFMDESFHFNSSKVLSHDVIRSLPDPTPFERWVANRAVRGCQKDHFHFSTAIRGIFWYDPALYDAMDAVLRSPVFGMNPADAREMIRRCFTEESQGMHEAARVHRTAVESYKAYVDSLDYVSESNKRMSLMSSNSLPDELARNKAAFNSWA